jgi:hypothetical protein
MPQAEDDDLCHVRALAPVPHRSQGHVQACHDHGAHQDGFAELHRLLHTRQQLHKSKLAAESKDHVHDRDQLLVGALPAAGGRDHQLCFGGWVGGGQQLVHHDANGKQLGAGPSDKHTRQLGEGADLRHTYVGG